MQVWLYFSANTITMKSLLNTFFSCIVVLAASGQGNVGIGFALPTERLQVDSAIKIGNVPWNASINNSRYLKFGDGGYVTIGENGLDDRLEFSAREFLF